MGKLVEHPLDTVKVRLQAQQNGCITSMHFKGPVDCAYETFRWEGIRGFYRGLSVPLAGTMLETACLFSINNKIMSWMRTPRDTGHQLPLWKVIVSGGITGGLVAVILTPMELIKSRLQVQTNTVKTYRGPLDCVLKSVKTEGWRVMFRGHVATTLREIPGTAAWFTSYDVVVRFLEPNLTPIKVVNGKETRNSPSPFTSMLGGAIGGTLYWLAFYPADTVKSAVQTSSNTRRRHVFWSMLLSIYKQHGVRGLYAGITPTLVRAAPSNAAVFVTYEWLSNHLYSIS